MGGLFNRLLMPWKGSEVVKDSGYRITVLWYGWGFRSNLLVPGGWPCGHHFESDGFDSLVSDTKRLVQPHAAAFSSCGGSGNVGDDVVCLIWLHLPGGTSSAPSGISTTSLADETRGRFSGGQRSPSSEVHCTSPPCPCSFSILNKYFWTKTFNSGLFAKILLCGGCSGCGMSVAIWILSLSVLYTDLCFEPSVKRHGDFGLSVSTLISSGGNVWVAWSVWVPPVPFSKPCTPMAPVLVHLFNPLIQ